MLSVTSYANGQEREGVNNFAMRRGGVISFLVFILL